MDVVYATNEETAVEYYLNTIETEFSVRNNCGTVTRMLNEVMGIREAVFSKYCLTNGILNGTYK